MESAYGIIKGILASDGGAIGITIGVGWLAFWIYGKALKIVHDHGILEKDCKKNDDNIQALKEAMLVIKASVTSMDGKLESLSVKLDNLTGKHEGLTGKLETVANVIGQNTPTFKRRSPLALSDTGTEIAKGMNADVLIARKWESDILPTLDTDLQSKNPYDIQQYCMEKIPFYPERFFDPQDIEDVKLYAFKNGHSLYICFQVAGLIIRDKYLERIGVNVSEIDKHDPSKKDSNP